MSYTLFTFESAHGAIAAQSLLARLSPVTMPVPRDISASCGIALRVKDEDAEEASRRLAGSDIGRDMYACYRITADGRGRAVRIEKAE